MKVDTITEYNVLKQTETGSRLKQHPLPARELNEHLFIFIVRSTFTRAIKHDCRSKCHDNVPAQSSYIKVKMATDWSDASLVGTDFIVTCASH